MSAPKGWIGVDLDGTLAVYDRWHSIYHFGEPIKPMVERIKAWLAEGWEVRIFTARVSGLSLGQQADFMEHLQEWLRFDAGLPHLPVTNVKDFEMVELWDDRAVSVEPNTGRQLAPSNINRGIA